MLSEMNLARKHVPHTKTLSCMLYPRQDQIISFCFSCFVYKIVSIFSHIASVKALMVTTTYLCARVLQTMATRYDVQQEKCMVWLGIGLPPKVGVYEGSI